MTSPCCEAAGGRKAPGWVRRIRAAVAWALPGAVMVLVPKCPACLAAHVTLWTGLGLSFTAATYLRWALLILCGAALFTLIVVRLNRLGVGFRYFRKGTEQCDTKS